MTRTITIDDDDEDEFQRIRKTLTNFLIIPESLSDEQHADLCRLESLLVAAPPAPDVGEVGRDAVLAWLGDPGDSVVVPTRLLCAFRRRALILADQTRPSPHHAEMMRDICQADAILGWKVEG